MRRVTYVNGNTAEGKDIVRKAMGGATPIKVRRGAPWLRAFLAQAQAFPDVVHDDMVDAVVGAWQQAQQGEFAWATVER